jgi:predicted transcriptional regulator
MVAVNAANVMPHRLSSSPPWNEVPVTSPQPDARSDHRKALDNTLAAAPLPAIPASSPGDVLRPLEALIPPHRPEDIIGEKAMTTITIPLSDESAERLHRLAKEAGLPPEEFLQRLVERILDRPDAEFQKAADDVLQKNADLYRRLA